MLANVIPFVKSIDKDYRPLIFFSLSNFSLSLDWVWREDKEGGFGNDEQDECTGDGEDGGGRFSERGERELTSLCVPRLWTS